MLLEEFMQLEYEKRASWVLCRDDPGSELTLTSAEMCRLACVPVVLKSVMTGPTGFMEVYV